jgi:hypothetical protein
MGLVMKVILFPQYALVLVCTAVADIWRFAKLVTELLLVILAQIVAKTARGATSRAVGLVTAKIAPLTTIAFHTPVVDAAWCSLVADCGARTDFPRNG